MLLIVDDIQVGCGRTGTFFSFEAAGIRPDIITLSKSLSGFGLPMSLVLMKPELDVWKPGAHSGTFRGNNLAFVTATQALETYWTNAAFSAEIQRKESLVRDWLENLVHSFPNAGLSVRGRGLIQGLVSNASPALANRIAKRAFGKGVVIETSGAQDEVLKLLPALTIEEGLLMRGLEVIEASVSEALADEDGQSARILKLEVNADDRTQCQDVIGTADEVRTDTWVSRRVLLKKDGMGFSFHETTIFPGGRTHPLQEPPGSGLVRRGRRLDQTIADGKTYALEPGVVYAERA